MPATTSIAVAPSRRSPGAPAARPASIISPTVRSRTRISRCASGDLVPRARAGLARGPLHDVDLRPGARLVHVAGAGCAPSRASRTAARAARSPPPRRARAAPACCARRTRPCRPTARRPAASPEPQAVARAPRRGAQHQVAGVRRDVARDQVAVRLEAAGREHHRDVVREARAAARASRTSPPAARSSASVSCARVEPHPGRERVAGLPLAPVAPRATPASARSVVEALEDRALQLLGRRRGTPTGTRRSRGGAR